MKKFLTVKEAAEYLSCSKSLLDQDRLTGLLKIPFSRLGRKILYNVDDLNTFLERNREGWGAASE